MTTTLFKKQCNGLIKYFFPMCVAPFIVRGAQHLFLLRHFAQAKRDKTWQTAQDPRAVSIPKGTSFGLHGLCYQKKNACTPILALLYEK